MTAPLIELTGVTKIYPAEEPLRIGSLRVSPGETLALGGFDAGAAEMLILLITGAAVPDEGVVRTGGQDTRTIATDTAWLESLDRFGLVTHRAVLIDKLSILSNMALPLTIAIDPVPDDVRPQVVALATEVGLPEARLDDLAGTLTADERLRVHLARALAPGPAALLLEHPTRTIETMPARVAFGTLLRDIATRRGLAFVALTDDPAFAKASRARRLNLDSTTGALKTPRWWHRS